MSVTDAPICTPRACALRLRATNASGVPLAGLAAGAPHPDSGTVSLNPIAPGLGDTLPCFRASVAVFVGQPALEAVRPSETCLRLGWSPMPACASPAFVVGQPASTACLGSWSYLSLPLSGRTDRSAPESFQSRVVAVVQPARVPVEALADVRSTDARSAEIVSFPGVARSFQVSLYKVEPSESVLARNLLAVDLDRAAMLDEPEGVRP